MSAYKLGYLTVFDTTTLINYTALKPMGIAKDTSKVAMRTYELPNGTKVNWDGTGDSIVTPGKATQEILATAGGMTLFNALTNKQGNYGVLTLTRLNSNPATVVTLTCNAVLDMVDDFYPQAAHDTAVMHLRVTFELISAWS